MKTNATTKRQFFVGFVALLSGFAILWSMATAQTFAYNPINKAIQTHLFLDKQLFKPGEDVNYRLWVFDAISSNFVSDPWGHGQLTILNSLGTQVFHAKCVFFSLLPLDPSSHSREKANSSSRMG